MQKIHRKVLDKGIPPDVMPGIKGVKVKYVPQKTRNISLGKTSPVGAHHIQDKDTYARLL